MFLFFMCSRSVRQTFYVRTLSFQCVDDHGRFVGTHGLENVPGDKGIFSFYMNTGFRVKIGKMDKILMKILEIG